MCEWNSPTSMSSNPDTLRIPNNLCTWRENRYVCIDRCISRQVEKLWKANVETLGCCCGHDEVKFGGITVIVNEKYSDSDIGKIVSLIEKHDGRTWSVLQLRNHKLEKVGVSNAKDKKQEGRVNRTTK